MRNASTHIGLAILAYLAVVLQAGVGNATLFGIACPNFLFLLIVPAALRLSGGAAVFWGGLLGLLSDCLSPGKLGPDLMIGAVAVVGIRRVLQTWQPESVISITVLCFVTVLGCDVASSIVGPMLTALPIEPIRWIKQAAQAAACSASLAFAAMISWRMASAFGRGMRTKAPARLGNRWHMLTE